jgi:hypothetical protein
VKPDKFLVTAVLVEAAQAEGWSYRGATLNQAWPSGGLPQNKIFWHAISGPRIFTKTERRAVVYMTHAEATALLSKRGATT